MGKWKDKPIFNNEEFNETKELCNGIFWFINDEIFDFPVINLDDTMIGLSKKGTSLNHKKLWDNLPNKITHGKKYDYYPRGRVEIDKLGRVTIWINPCLNDPKYLQQIILKFGIRSSTDATVKNDHSEHYKCYLDRE
jgi:hypothetical protein